MLNHLKTEHSYKANPKLLTQFQYCEDQSIPYAVVIGEGEIQAGVVKLRNIATRNEETVKRDQLIEVLRQRLAQL